MATTSFNPTIKEQHKEEPHMEHAKEAAGQAWNKAVEAGSEAAGAAKEAGAEALGKVKQAGAATLEKARETAESAGELASETASAVGRKADEMTGAAGHGIRTFGENLAQKSAHEGLAGYVSQTAADSLKGAGRYVEEHKLSGMAHDLEAVIKNHPIPSVLICLGIGICLGRALKD